VVATFAVVVLELGVKDEPADTTTGEVDGAVHAKRGCEP